MIQPAAGTLLIADPFLRDPNFMRTVVCLCEHNPEGSFGFVLSKKLDITIGDLIPNMAGFDFPVYEGGPVQRDTAHVLHCYPDLIPESLPVCPGVYWGGNFEAVVAAVRNGDIDPRKLKFFVGYSGWSGGQLDQELSENSWLTVQANRHLIMLQSPGDIWKESLNHMGGEYKQLINYPVDPQLN